MISARWVADPRDSNQQKYLCLINCKHEKSRYNIKEKNETVDYRIGKVYTIEPALTKNDFHVYESRRQFIQSYMGTISKEFLSQNFILKDKKSALIKEVDNLFNNLLND